MPLLAQIVAIADTYDAITTTRPYALAKTPEHAYEELRRDAERGALSRDLVDVFVTLGREGQLAAALSATPSFPA